MARKMDLHIWVEETVVTVMAMTLSFLSVEFASNGLDLSLEVVPLVLYSFHRGLLPGIVVGFVWSMLNIILGTATRNFLSAPQVISECPFAFAFGGTGSVFARKIQLYFQANHLRSAIRAIILGSVVAVSTRWFWHFWAGVLVWDMYTPEGMSPYLCSFVPSGISAVINCLYVSPALGLSAKIAPQLFVPKKQVEF